MIKQAMAGAGLAQIAVIGVVMFVAIFVAIVIWAMSRSRQQVDTWSSLPLADGTDPVEPREPTSRRSSDNNGLNVVSKPSESCGKCEHCTC